MSLRLLRVCAALVALSIVSGCAHHATVRSSTAVADESSAAPTDSSGSRGGRVFAMQCAMCHGAGGAGGPAGPSLRGERTRKSLAAVVAAIKHPTPPMPKLFPGILTAQDVADLAAYVQSL